MPRSGSIAQGTRPRGLKSTKGPKRQAELRYTVALPPDVLGQVERYARTLDTSMSKAISTLVRLGLEGQRIRKQEFFKRLKANLDNDDPNDQDRLVDEFRDLILGR
jgi:hypothetical protein